MLVKQFTDRHLLWRLGFKELRRFSQPHGCRATWPCFFLIASWRSLSACILVVAWLQLLKAGYSGVLPSLLGEQFPVVTRAIGVALSFSTAVTIFGGFAPLVATWLIAVTGDPLSPSYYLIVTAAMSAAALAVIQERSARELQVSLKPSSV